MLSSDQERALEQFSLENDCNDVRVLPNQDRSAWFICGHDPHNLRSRLVLEDGSTPLEFQET